MKTEAVEWQVLCNGEFFFLTEKQHAFLLENQDKRFVHYGKFTINPAFTSWMKQRPAEVVKELYPCLFCNTNGYLIGESDGEGNWKTCSICNGTGMDNTK